MPETLPADPLAERLQRCYASAVHDVLRAQGHDNCLLPHNIRPLNIRHTLAGEIWTVSGHIDRTKSAAQTLITGASAEPTAEPRPVENSMADDMDVNAGRILEGAADLDAVGREIFHLIQRVGAGELTKSEGLGHQEFILTYKSFEPIGPACLPAVA